MAIQVGGTTVVNDSRELQNIATLDSTTTTTITNAVGGGASVQTFTSSGTWTKPSSGTVALVTCIGGGGGGGQSYYYNATGASGGGIQSKWIPLSELGSTVTVTIGAGGAGSTGFSDAGGNGGATSFGNHLYVIGGNGGNAQNGYYSNTQTTAGNSGVTSFPSDYTDSSEYVSSSMVFVVNRSSSDYNFYSSSIVPSAEGSGTANLANNSFFYTNPKIVPWCKVGNPGVWDQNTNARVAPTNSNGYGAPGVNERANTFTSGGANTAQAGTNGFCSVVVF